MKQTKKLLSIFLSLCMLFSITAGLNFSSFALTSGDFEYKVLSNNTAEIIHYDGSGGNVTIPSTIDGYTVTSIGSQAFSYCPDLTTVTIPKSVISIDSSAFLDNWLTNIYVDSNNKNYSSHSGVLFNKNKTKLIQYPNGNTRISYAVPNSVISIGESAFTHSNNLANVTIGKNVKTIGREAFYNSRKLNSISIPNSVTEIGELAFRECYNIKTIKIGSGLKKIGFGAFPGGIPLLDNLIESFIVDKNNKYFSSEDGVLFNKNKTKLLLYPANKSEKTYYVPISVKSFGLNDDAAFAMCYNLENIIIPKNVENIEHSFIICGLKTVTILNKNCKIGNDNYFDGVSETNTTFKGLKNSTTEKYAKSLNCKFVEVKDAYNYKLSLSTSNYTYNGKAKKPSVTVKDSKGKKIASSNYTVTYSSGRKTVGKYTVTIKFKGNYSGIIKKTFTIKPKSTTISKLTAGKKAFTVKLKKQATQTTGYQIQYSTSSKFKNAKTVTVSKNSTISKKISKLKAKKKYYVRVRTYKTVNGSKIYSSWSKAKTVKTK